MNLIRRIKNLEIKFIPKGDIVFIRKVLNPSKEGGFDVNLTKRVEGHV
jgi:hypothetical protein